MNKMSKENETIGQGGLLINQFKDKWRMLKQTINKIPDEKWHNRKNK